MPPPIAFIFTHRIQYFTNLLDEMHRRGQVEPIAIYARETAAVHDRGFDRKICWDNRIATAFREIILDPSSPSSAPVQTLAACLQEVKPGCIHLNGYADPIQWRAWLWARTHGVPICVRGDGDTLKPSNPWRALPRNLLARLYTRAACRVFFQGHENRKYWLARGASPEQLRWLPCVSDTSVFHGSAFPNQEARNTFRREHGAKPRDIVFVVSGKLEPRKRPADALHMLARLSSPSTLNQPPSTSAKVWFLGSGPLESDLKSRAAALGITDRIHWWGFRNQTEIPAILQAADVLLHLSEADPWPYSVLDGASSSLALVLSDRTGSYPDWLEAPPACLVFPHGNIAELANAIIRLVNQPELLNSLRNAAREKSRQYTEREFCHRFEHEMFATLGSPHPAELCQPTPKLR